MKCYKQLKYSFTLFLSTSVGLMLSLSATALDLKPGDVLPPPIKMKMETDALESSIISLSLSMSGNPTKAITKPCATCASQTFIIKPETKFALGESAIPRERISSFSGKSGTVIYYPETKIVHSIHFFNLED